MLVARVSIMHDQMFRTAAVTPERWSDLMSLFGDRGACGGCWCMVWRLKRREFEAGKGAANRERLRSLVASGEEPGILAYRNDEVVGWCAIARKEEYVALESSRVLKPPDVAHSYVISCFFVAKGARGQGVSGALIRGAVDWAQRRGAHALLGFPNDPGAGGPAPPPFVWTGLLRPFLQAGFREVVRRSSKRPIVRLDLRPFELGEPDHQFIGDV